MDYDPVKVLLDSAKDSFDTAEQLFVLKKYHHSLFFFHLSIEKVLKALCQQKTNQPAPPIHNLTRLATTAGLTINDEQIEQLDEISSYNVTARYDDYKRSFYKKASKEYTETWRIKVLDMYSYLLTLIK